MTLDSLQPKRLDPAETVFQVAIVTLQRSLRGGRSLLLVALIALPCLLGAAFGRGAPDEQQARMLYELLAFYQFGIAVPATALVLATAFPWPESDEGTLTYWFTAPVRRWAVHLGRLVANVLLGSVALCLAVLALAFCLDPSDAIDVAGPVRTSLTATLLAYPAYLCIFTLLATATRRGMIGGLALILVENFLGVIPAGNVSRITMILYVRSLLHPASSPLGQTILEEKAGVATPAAAGTAVAVFLTVTVITGALALVLVQIIEYRGKHAQPG